MSDTKRIDDLLARIDRAANYIQKNASKLGIPPRIASEIAYTLDSSADEIEKTAYGEESLHVRQEEIVKSASQRQAEVISRNPDEPYMDTFKAPSRPIQTDGDESYMDLYADDQTSAVHHGKSSTGRPLAP